MILKMFHVKHFGKVAAEILTRAHTRLGLRRVCSCAKDVRLEMAASRGEIWHDTVRFSTAACALIGHDARDRAAIGASRVRVADVGNEEFPKACPCVGIWVAMGVIWFMQSTQAIAAEGRHTH